FPRSVGFIPVFDMPHLDARPPAAVIVDQHAFPAAGALYDSAVLPEDVQLFLFFFVDMIDGHETAHGPVAEELDEFYLAHRYRIVVIVADFVVGVLHTRDHGAHRALDAQTTIPATDGQRADADS